jgi:diguanylate cyclase (GGDEF)-like protein
VTYPLNDVLAKPRVIRPADQGSHSILPQHSKVRAPHIRPRSPTPHLPVQGARFTPAQWDAIAAPLDFAFQPIVNIQNGECFGYEALLRNVDTTQFRDIPGFFEAAFCDGMLYRIDLQLRAKAIAKFAQLPNAGRVKLFYNIDNRCHEMPDYAPGRTSPILARHGLYPEAMYLEISELHDLSSEARTEEVVEAYRRQGYRLAVDDYGVGFSQFKSLYLCQPDVIKIDRFFITNIDRDRLKEMFVAQLTNFSHLVGAIVVAEGVEREEEYRVCRQLGCDLAQGYWIQRPTTVLADLGSHFPMLAREASHDRRSARPDRRFISANMLRVEPVPHETDFKTLYERFMRRKEHVLLPVVDSNNHPLGIIHESDLKGFTYSLYGRDLLENKGIGLRVRDIVRKCPVVELSESTDTILNLAVLAGNQNAVIVTNNLCYAGLLDGSALLRMVNEKNLSSARDENPLTGLPGNRAIHLHISDALACPGEGHVHVYFDFDNFKPFNDAYGFRQGDRAILLFAELLKKVLAPKGWFIGHVGGDDFFASMTNITIDDVCVQVRALCSAFAEQIVAFYDQNARVEGCIRAKSRDGELRYFPLMTISAAVLAVSSHGEAMALDDIGPLLAQIKLEAKASCDHIACATFPPRPLPSIA